MLHFATNPHDRAYHEFLSGPPRGYTSLEDLLDLAFPAGDFIAEETASLAERQFGDQAPALLHGIAGDALSPYEKCLRELDELPARLVAEGQARFEEQTARLDALAEQAHWRLNESEALLQQGALGHFAQIFFWPLGARRNASSRFPGESDYFRGLPVHHRGSLEVSSPVQWFEGYPAPQIRFRNLPR